MYYIFIGKQCGIDLGYVLLSGYQADVGFEGNTYQLLAQNLRGRVTTDRIFGFVGAGWRGLDPNSANYCISAVPGPIVKNPVPPEKTTVTSDFFPSAPFLGIPEKKPKLFSLKVPTFKKNKGMERF